MRSRTPPLSLHLPLVFASMGWATACGSDPKTPPQAQTRTQTQTEDCTPLLLYVDEDGDGFGDNASATMGDDCTPSADLVVHGGDCEDGDPTIRPGQLELCDGLDNDCDGLVDDADSIVFGGTIWYADQDGDGFGDADQPLPGHYCVGPPSSAAQAGDCDDTDPDVHPEHAEVPHDGEDNNCDGLTDLDGRIRGTWRRAYGSSVEPGYWECDVTWSFEGTWRPDACPDCDLSFFVTIETEEAPHSDTPCALPDGGMLAFGLRDPGTADTMFSLFTYSEPSAYPDPYGYGDPGGFRVVWSWAGFPTEWENGRLGWDVRWYDYYYWAPARHQWEYSNGIDVFDAVVE